MISYREKELMMVQKFLADHAYNTTLAIEDYNPSYLFENKLKACSSYEEIVEYVKSQGYCPSIRIEDLLSPEELRQLDQEYEEIEREFRKVTKLNKFDAGFVVTATAMQLLRQILQPKIDASNFDYDSRLGHDDSAKNAKQEHKEKYGDKEDSLKQDAKNDKSKGSRYYYAPLREIMDLNEGVPYDIPNIKGYVSHFGGSNHRIKTLGHDPSVIGYVFGTCNILTNTMSLGKENSFRTLHIKRIPVNGRNVKSAVAEGNMVLMFQHALTRFKESKSTVALAFLKQLYHIKSDQSSTDGLGLGFLQLLFNSDVIEQMIDAGFDYDNVHAVLGAGAKQAALAELINFLISLLHRIYLLWEDCQNNGTELTVTNILNSEVFKRNQKLSEVRTRKIILISNSISSGINTVIVGGEAIAGVFSENPEVIKDAVKHLDLGGLLVTFKHLFSDTRFITKIKKEYIQKAIQENFDKKIKSADVD